MFSVDGALQTFLVLVLAGLTGTIIGVGYTQYSRETAWASFETNHNCVELLRVENPPTPVWVKKNLILVKQADTITYQCDTGIVVHGPSS